MSRLTLTEFIITIALVLGALYLGAQAYQSWLTKMTTTTITKLQEPR